MRVAAQIATAPLAAKAALICAAAVALLLGAALLLAALATIAAGEVRTGTVCTLDAGSGGGRAPARFRALYAEAAKKYRLGERGPAILASIHETESGFGQNQGPSSAGAVGQMQFMPATWAIYGVDADGDGRRDPANPKDAIFAAARYLRASGAPGSWYRAIFAYNRAGWYVAKILRGARAYTGVCRETEAVVGELRRLSGSRHQRVLKAASAIARRRYPYCWGGGHGPRPGPTGGSYCWSAGGSKRFGSGEKGLDCSGAVRWLLVLAGYKDPGGIVSGSFAARYKPGRGRALTIYSNAGHVFVHIRGRGFWGTTSSNYRHGPGWIRSYPTAGFTASHPAGL